MTLTFLDFFAGAGLVEIALPPTWQCVWANDIDPKKAGIHSANLGGVYLTADVSDLSACQIPDANMAWASFPCQDLSLAGWRRGMSANRSGAFWPFWRLMREMHDEGRRPPIIALENVAGLLHDPDFAGLCESLVALDMRFGALLINAKEFLPQSRPRVFIVAVDAAIDAAHLTTPFPGQSRWFDTRVTRAFEALPAALQDRWLWWNLPVPDQPVVGIETIIEEDPTGVSWHSRAETDRLLGMMSQAHLAQIEHHLSQESREVGFLYKRIRHGVQRAEVRFDGIAGCLRTPSGGSSIQTILVVENGEVRSRLLSPREYARLMGLDDSFQLPTSNSSAYRAMGDGVAVPVVAWLGQHLLTPLAQAVEEHRESYSQRSLPMLPAELQIFRENAESMASSWSRASR